MWRGTRRTGGASDAFEIERRLRDLPGSDSRDGARVGSPRRDVRGVGDAARLAPKVAGRLRRRSTGAWDRTGVKVIVPVPLTRKATMRKHLSTLLIAALALAAFGGSAGIATAKNGADDPVGHVRHSADDGAGHVRHSGADDTSRAARRAHRRGRHGADDHRAGHVRRGHGADDAPNHG